MEKTVYKGKQQSSNKLVYKVKLNPSQILIPTISVFISKNRTI